MTGTWLLEDDALVIDDLLVERRRARPSVAPQDAHVTAVLASGPAAAIDEDRLTLTAPDGRGAASTRRGAG